mmetsp:Transcript_6306/g.16055  ORF Transcript_6306/g.16055 Transcript_6306/m.16055 type:complete len:203 (-) Transcript_6306:169-777(-)
MSQNPANGEELAANHSGTDNIATAATKMQRPWENGAASTAPLQLALPLSSFKFQSYGMKSRETPSATCQPVCFLTNAFTEPSALTKSTPYHLKIWLSLSAPPARPGFLVGLVNHLLVAAFNCSDKRAPSKASNGKSGHESEAQLTPAWMRPRAPNSAAKPPLPLSRITPCSMSSKLTLDPFTVPNLYIQTLSISRTELTGLK